MRKCIPKCNPECDIEANVKDLVIYGRITECATDEPIVGAIVKGFVVQDCEEIPITHSYSGCDGRYLLNIPQAFEHEGRVITIKPGDELLINANCSGLPPVPCHTCQNDCTC